MEELTVHLGINLLKFGQPEVTLGFEGVELFLGQGGARLSLLEHFTLSPYGVRQGLLQLGFLCLGLLQFLLEPS